MKTNLSQYIRLFRENYGGNPWYGDSLRKKLDDIQAEEALKAPAPGLHSIAQQVAHLLAWRRLLVERLKGNDNFQIQVNSARDWPPQELLEQKGWEKLLKELEANQNELLKLLEAESDALLERPLPDGKHAFRLLLDGIVQHDVYHIGQIGQALALLHSKQHVSAF
ncbi:MAG: DinB family protein [Saprospiraceae bacterium]